ncbi:PRC and DUF2382 domain-containing protein [Parafrigoribacterium mesophilum]|uniref:PRC and DUF2382 domain-containing protein n=1 Tax=Parafrigoribacterium mesophilum TaxID=433646 RepID=UPI0031FD67E3
MIDTKEISRVIGAPVVDPRDNKVGTVGQIYVDPKGRPLWATVKTGLFGTSQSFVPLENASADRDVLRVGFEKEFVKDAPRIDDDGALSEADEQALYEYYHLDYSAANEATGADYSTDTDYTTDADYMTGHDTTGPNTDSAMTRSEEQLRVDKEQTQRGTARLHKYVVTEEQNITVPVSHEEVRVEREPITDANRDEALSGPDISEEDHEVTLNEERVVVSKEATPVERVRLDKETVTEDQQVSEQVRKEQIDFDEDGTTRRNQHPNRR